jgi:hypothetical protein
VLGLDRLRPYFRRQPRTASPQTPAVQAATPTPIAAAVAQTAPAGASPTPAVGGGELASRREDLARRLAELQWDLGGLTYEMAIRDQFRPDLLARRAAELQQLDAELASIDRLLHIEQGGAAGACPACGALFTRGAAYCWQCGAGLVSQPPVTPTPSPAPPTPSSAVPPAQPPAA